MSAEKCVMVQTTMGDDRQAAELAALIVKERLAACVQRVPVRSTYRWQGKVETSEEVLVIAKTRTVLAEPLTRFIRARHSYELPEILVTPIRGGLAEYLDWVRTETGS